MGITGFLSVESFYGKEKKKKKHGLTDKKNSGSHRYDFVFKII